MDSASYQVKSVGKAIRLLDCLAESGRPMHLQEIANLTGWPKSTVYGLLSAMREASVVEQSPETGCYRLGIRLFEYGCRVSSSWDVVQQSRKTLEEISLRSGATAFISKLDRDEAIMLEHCAATSAFRVVTDDGDRTPLHCTAQGKALLAWQSASEVKRFMQEKGLPPFTPHTITSPAILEAELARIREEGIAVEDGEYKIGLRAVASPIRNWNGTVDCCVGLVGLFRRTNSEDFLLARRLVADAAEQISAAVGYKR